MQPFSAQFFYFLILLQVRFPRKQKLRWRFGWTGKENKERLGRERCQAWQSLERNLSTSSGEIWRWVSTSEISSFQVRCPGFYTKISLCDVDGKNVLSSAHPRGGWKLRAICLHHGWQICIHPKMTFGELISASLRVHPWGHTGHFLYRF